jgi:hypothetical protein
MKYLALSLLLVFSTSLADLGQVKRIIASRIAKQKQTNR